MKVSSICLTTWIVLGSSSVHAQCTDLDGDGYFASSGCGSPKDCNDAAAGTHPGAVELCDGYDNDCNGHVDDGRTCDTSCDVPGKIGGDLRLTTDPGESSYPVLVGNGNGFGLSWSDVRDGLSDLFFALLSPSGTKTTDDEELSNYTINSAVKSAAVWTGSEYGFSWTRYHNGSNENYFTRADRSGTEVGDDVQIPTDTGSSLQPSMAWTGSEYGLVWEDERNGPSQIYFARLDASGAKIGEYTGVSDLPWSRQPHVAWTGTEFGVIWEYYPDLYFARLDAYGNKIGGDVRVARGSEPSLLWTGAEYGLAWQDYRDGNYEIFFARLDANGANIGAEVRVTHTPGFSVEPSLAWTGSEYGLAWQDSPDGNYEVFFARLDRFGAKIGDDLRVTNDTAFSGETSLVWSGSEYGLAWHDGRDGNGEIYFTRIGCRLARRTGIHVQELPRR